MRRDLSFTGTVTLATLFVLVAPGCSGDQQPDRAKSIVGTAGPRLNVPTLFKAKRNFARSAVASGALRQAAIATIQRNAARSFHFRQGKDGVFSGRGALVSRLNDGRLNVSVGQQHLQLDLAHLGRPKKRQALPAMPSTQVKDNRLTFQHRGVIDVDEWFVNGALGIEHGFDIVKRPSGQGHLELALNVRGSLNAHTASANAVVFRNVAGDTVLRYQDAFAYDADQRSLPIELSVRDGQVLLSVDDSKARYPITVDPLLVDEQKLISSNPATGDLFGSCVDVLGNTAVIGAPGMAGGGAAFVFTRSGSTWTEQQMLTGAGSVSLGRNCTFADATNLIVVADPGAGHTRIYHDAGSGTYALASIVAGSGSVSFDSGVLAIGDGNADVALVIGVNPDGTSNPSILAALNASDGVAGDGFGSSIAISGGSVIVGAPDKDNKTGAAYVFSGSLTSWPEQAKLTATNGQQGDRFGVAVGISDSDNLALVGAPAANTGRAGTVHRFRRTITTWNEDPELSPGLPGDELGASLRLYKGGLSVIGAPGIDSAKGAAVLASGIPPALIAGGIAVAPDGLASDRFGAAVALDRSLSIPLPLLFGAPGASSKQGAVYVKVPAAANGVACVTGAECLSDHCVDGVCCNSACGGAGDCRVCNQQGSVGACTVAVQGTKCRGETGICDVPEVCDGASLTCPADAVAGANTPCRPAGPGGCDAAEFCDGTNKTCPADGVAAAGKECRAAGGDCDIAEFCDGTTKQCPLDEIAGAGATCRSANGACDVAELCDGSSKKCPVDAVEPTGTICRAAVMGGCDIVDICDGAAKDCPSDAVVPAGVQCRAAAGDCDVAESCNGTANRCPPNGFVPDGTACPSGQCVAGQCIPTTPDAGPGNDSGVLVDGGATDAGGNDDAGADVGIGLDGDLRVRGGGCDCTLGRTHGVDASPWLLLTLFLLWRSLTRRRLARS